jgi:hypothetical protein
MINITILVTVTEFTISCSFADTVIIWNKIFISGSGIVGSILDSYYISLILFCTQVLLYVVTNIFYLMPHVPYGIRGLPSRLWPKCNRLLKLGRPWALLRCPDEVDGDI